MVSNWREQVELESDETWEILTIFLSMDKEYNVFERRVTTIAYSLSSLGGLYEIFILGGSFIIGMFSERLFVSSIVHKIYQVDKKEEGKSKDLVWQEAQTTGKGKTAWDRKGKQISDQLVKADRDNDHEGKKRCMKEIENELLEWKPFRYSYLQIM